MVPCITLCSVPIAARSKRGLSIGTASLQCRLRVDSKSTFILRFYHRWQAGVPFTGKERKRMSVEAQTSGFNELGFNLRQMCSCSSIASNSAFEWTWHSWQSWLQQNPSPQLLSCNSAFPNCGLEISLSIPDFNFIYNGIASSLVAVTSSLLTLPLRTARLPHSLANPNCEFTIIFQLPPTHLLPHPLQVEITSRISVFLEPFTCAQGF